MNAYKVHTDNLGGLADCIRKGMYGVSQKAIKDKMPKELLTASVGDIVFISEKEISNNALFGPFYVVAERSGIVAKSRKGNWIEINIQESVQEELAYWVTLEDMKWCLLFDMTVIDRISIVWPRDWAALNLTLPSWGIIPGEYIPRLINYTIKNEQSAQEFLTRIDT